MIRLVTPDDQQTSEHEEEFAAENEASLKRLALQLQVQMPLKPEDQLKVYRYLGQLMGWYEAEHFITGLGGTGKSQRLPRLNVRGTLAS